MGRVAVVVAAEGESPYAVGGWCGPLLLGRLMRSGAVPLISLAVHRIIAGPLRSEAMPSRAGAFTVITLLSTAASVVPPVRVRYVAASWVRPDRL